MSLGESQILSFRRQKSRQIRHKEDDLPQLSAEGGARYRKRALAMLLAAGALWIAIYEVARLFFH